MSQAKAECPKGLRGQHSWHYELRQAHPSANRPHMIRYCCCGVMQKGWPRWSPRVEEMEMSRDPLD